MSDTKRTYADGRAVEPLYTSAEAQQPGFRAQPWWTMVQEHGVDKEFAANNWALDRLKHGASGLIFYLTDEHYLPRILKDIELPYINLGLVVEGSGSEVMEALLHHAHGEIVSAKDLRGFINIDPVEIVARTGRWHEEKMYDLGELSRLSPEGMKFMCVNANFYGICGADAITQLGLAAAHLDFYLEIFGTVGLKQYWLALSTGTHMFQEIAKHRAARLLWSKLLERHELPQVPLEIYSETTTVDQSGYDIHTNLLRATSAAFGAIVGGADHVQIRPYDALAGGSAEGERLALNQHFILAYESYLDRVEDPASGSFFIESQTAEMVEGAWAILENITQKGGILEALRNGIIQNLLEEQVERTMPEKVLGVNLYPLQSQKLPDQMIVKALRTRQ
ncbi:MAG: hypothetical protein RL754_582, partial [Bacteroidota bacterium]